MTDKIDNTLLKESSGIQQPAEVAPVPKRRGRPPKKLLEAQAVAAAAATTDASAAVSDNNANAAAAASEGANAKPSAKTKARAKTKANATAADANDDANAVMSSREAQAQSAIFDSLRPATPEQMQAMLAFGATTGATTGVPAAAPVGATAPTAAPVPATAPATAAPLPTGVVATESVHGIRKPRRATAVKRAMEPLVEPTVTSVPAAATPVYPVAAPLGQHAPDATNQTAIPQRQPYQQQHQPQYQQQYQAQPQRYSQHAQGSQSNYSNQRDQRDRRQDNQQQQNNQKGKGAQGKGQQNNKNDRQQRQRKQYTPKEVIPQVTREDLAALKVAELRAKAAEIELDVSLIKKKDELIDAVLEGMIKAEGFIDCAGVLDLLPEGYGFLRTSGYLPGDTDVYVGVSVIRRNGLRKGDYVKGQVRPARESEKFAAIQRIDSVNGMSLEDLQRRSRFADLTPVYPDQRLLMEHGKSTITARTIDLVAPIGKGQRGLIVSPPKAGKTTILKDIAAAITSNSPEVHLMCLLVDERPEEVTDMQRSIHGEVVSSTFDMPSENHIAVAELVIERAKRLVECGKDVVILLDSITRLARAYNLAQPASGRILSGGVDSTALYPPKRFLGAARNIENGGSLTILASALIDTGSKMDEVIFEEFKGTGNMELRLDRDLADRRIFPAIDPISSGTRKEELLLDQQEAPLIWAVRRILANLSNTERAMEMLIKSLKQTEDNSEFLMRTAKKAQSSAQSSGDMVL
ncbi:MAG: transcription termination factor Rho [Coriobacteriales bacterium]|nr:transcription termination factor Rho [Coriobacteriales bacterium]